MLNLAKRDRIFSSMRLSKASNLALIASSDAMVYAFRYGWPRLSPCIESMRLGTRQECVGSSPRVSGVCQDGAREFAKRRLRLAERLLGVAEKLAESRDVGSPRKFARRFTEGIRKLSGNAKGDRRKENQRTCRKIAGVYRNRSDGFDPPIPSGDYSVVA
ncbi:hypothetical protein B296_00022379 [Ensete ventricosum]|uniref:Uncharacterized protein n=1 Tax=Ensete ventricosum TaxID=4639 RepID=A0A426Z5R5_ENSVE|nr:hypothetical protein B296_00022379 [Ensete ventricosum]